MLAAEIERVRQRHGFVIVLDGHSIVSEAPRFFAGRLPDLNLGTAEGASCAPALQARAAQLLAAADGFTHVVNGRFKGGWMTRNYGQPREACTRCNSRSRSDATWTNGRPGAGTPRAPHRLRACCAASSWRSLRAEAPA